MGVEREKKANFPTARGVREKNSGQPTRATTKSLVPMRTDGHITNTHTHTHCTTTVGRWLAVASIHVALPLFGRGKIVGGEGIQRVREREEKRRKELLLLLLPQGRAGASNSFSLSITYRRLAKGLVLLTLLPLLDREEEEQKRRDTDTSGHGRAGLRAATNQQGLAPPKRFGSARLGFSPLVEFRFKSNEPKPPLRVKQSEIPLNS